MTTATKISKPAWMIAPETVRVMEALLSNGGDARFVGGCVRDTLANRKVFDVDIATPLKPEEVMARLAAAKIDCVPTGLKHGTVTAIVDGTPFEITTLRVDVMTFGRHAQVRFTDDWHKDAARRDFTINAISCSIDGEVFDPFGGVEDLRLGRVAFVGNAEERIREDVLRILRFFRFYAHFGAAFDPPAPPDAEALRACAVNAHLIPRLSGERIRQETLKILESDYCPRVWRIMLSQGIVTHFLPEATNIRALERLVVLELWQESQLFALRRLSALLEVVPEGLRHIVSALRLSNAEASMLAHMTLNIEKVSPRMDETALRRAAYRSGNDMTRNLLLLSAARERGEALPDRPVFQALYTAATAFRRPRFPLIGDDVMKLGWTEGPDVGRILKEIEDWWVAEEFRPGRNECLARLRENFRRPPDVSS